MRFHEQKDDFADLIDAIKFSTKITLPNIMIMLNSNEM